MIQGVIFDLDGLMFDTERIWDSLWEPVLTELGLPYFEGIGDTVRGSTGDAMARTLRQLYGPDCDTAAIVAGLYRKAGEIFARPVPKKPGLDALLAWLKEQGIPAAVASSSAEQTVRTHLKNGGIEDCFAAVVAGDMVSRSKPAPDIFLKAAGLLGADPAHCLVLEDSHNGVRAGAAGGFITVMVPDMMPVTDEMRQLSACQCASLNEVLDKLRAGEF